LGHYFKDSFEEVIGAFAVGSESSNLSNQQNFEMFNDMKTSV